MLEVNKIHNGDCLELMKEIPDKSIDLVLTDPPYLLDNQGGVGKGDFAKRKLMKLKHINWISEDFDYNSVLNEFIRVCNPLNLYIFCSNKQISRTMSFFENKGYKVTLLMWHKTNAVPLGNNTYHSK